MIVRAAGITLVAIGERAALPGPARCPLRWTVLCDGRSRLPLAESHELATIRPSLRGARCEPSSKVEYRAGRVELWKQLEVLTEE